MSEKYSFRAEVHPADREAVRAVLDSTGFFYPAETAVAVELVEERLARGEASGYLFDFAESGGRVAGYTCFGPIACTRASYDLFWIAVHREQQGRGLGRLLLTRAEQEICRRWGQRVYIETSSRTLYEPTRRFYLGCGYRIEAVLEEFYGPADGKLIFVKAL